MADIVYLTPPEVRIGTGQTLPLAPTTIMPYAAIDVGGYDTLSLQIFCTLFIGSGSFDVEVWTGMQTDTTDGWILLMSHTVSGIGVALGQTFAHGGFLRYVTWRFPTETNMTTFGFCVRGSGRKRALVALP